MRIRTDQRRVDQAVAARRLSAWYGSNDGARARHALERLMHEWLGVSFCCCVLELSGLPEHADWLRDVEFKSRFHVGPLGPDAVSSFDALPLEVGSVDLLIACHVLEFAEDPHRLLREVERVLAPEGRCVLVMFNPLGPQGLAQPFGLFRGASRRGRFYSLARVRDWLSVLGLSVEKSGWFSPPFVVSGDRWWRKSANFALTNGLAWMGSLSALHVRKQVSRMTPAGESWEHFLKNKVAQPAALKPHASPRHAPVVKGFTSAP